MSPIRQIFYVSRSLAQPREVEWIVAGSRQANERRGITGMLFLRGGYFAQLFEGEAFRVQETVADIVADRRHEQIRTLMERDIAARMCDGWGMAFLSAPGADGRGEHEGADGASVRGPGCLSLRALKVAAVQREMASMAAAS